MHSGFFQGYSSLSFFGIAVTFLQDSLQYSDVSTYYTWHSKTEVLNERRAPEVAITNIYIITEWGLKIQDQ